MSGVYYNGSEVKDITISGKKVQSIYYNGTLVWKPKEVTSDEPTPDTEIVNPSA